MPRGRRLVIPGFRPKVFFLGSLRRHYRPCYIIGFIGLFCCIITYFNYPMDSRNSHRFTRTFWGQNAPSRFAHTAVCGGAQAPSAPGEVLKIHDFLISLALFLCKCPGLDLDAWKTCLSTLDHLSKFKSRCENSNSTLGTPRKSLPDAQIITFHQNPNVPDENYRQVVNSFLSDTGSVESLYVLIIPHRDSLVK